MQDEIYLSYKNVCLRKSDVNCFEDFNYLNDMCISFYYELMNEKFLPSINTNNSKNIINNFFLFDPVSASTIIFDDEIEDLYDMFAPLNLSSKEYLFLPINDNSDKYKIGGGSHWALIIYKKSDDTFYYLDSLCSYIKNTDILLRKIKAIINMEINKNNNQQDHFENFKIEFAVKNKFQLNTYDCGMFVLEFTETILNYIFSNNYNGNINSEIINRIILENVDQKNIKSKRKQILDIINKIKKYK